MIDFLPSDEQQLLVDGVRRLVEREIVPLEAELDPDAAELPVHHRERLAGIVAQMGLSNWDAPERAGGPGLDTVTQALIGMEMTQHRAGIYAPCYGVFGGTRVHQLYDANETQKETYLYPEMRGERKGFFALSEPSGGSDPARAIQTTAVRDGDDWIITGSKLWISNADKADFGLVYARTGDGRDGITAFIVETDMPGFEVRRIVHTLRSSHPGTELSFDGVRVPDSNRVGEIGGAFRLAAAELVRKRIPYAAQSLGAAIAAHRMATEYSQQRSVFGKLLAAQQGIQWMLVDSEVDIRSARLLVLDAAAKADRGEDARTESAIAKLVATEAASRVIDRSLQIHGAIGVSKDLPLERWYREIRIRRIGEGPSEVQRLIISRHLVGSHR